MSTDLGTDLPGGDITVAARENLIFINSLVMKLLGLINALYYNVSSME